MAMAEQHECCMWDTCETCGGQRCVTCRKSVAFRFGGPIVCRCFADREAAIVQKPTAVDALVRYNREHPHNPFHIHRASRCGRCGDQRCADCGAGFTVGVMDVECRCGPEIVAVVKVERVPLSVERRALKCARPRCEGRELRVVNVEYELTEEICDGCGYVARSRSGSLKDAMHLMAILGGNIELKISRFQHQESRRKPTL